MALPFCTLVLAVVLAAHAAGLEIVPTPSSVVRSGRTAVLVKYGLFHNADVFVDEALQEETEAADIVRSALTRYAGYLFGSGIDSLESSVGLLVVDIKKSTTELPADESYTLDIGEWTASRPEVGRYPDVTITATTCFGALRALETFVQLVEVRGSSEFEIQCVPFMAEDSPQYEWRGLNLDCASHFLPLGILERLIESMSWAKLNTLHLKLSGSTAFAFESRLYPNVTHHGAYAESAYYSYEELQFLHNFARYRGIRIIPEVVFPDEGLSIAKAMPHLYIHQGCTSIQERDLRYEIGSDREDWILVEHVHSRLGYVQLDLGKEEALYFRNTLAEETANIFSEQHPVHLSGRGATFRCESDPKYREARSRYLSEQLLVREDDFLRNFVRDASAYFNKSRPLVAWHDVGSIGREYLTAQDVVMYDTLSSLNGLQNEVPSRRMPASVVFVPQEWNFATLTEWQQVLHVREMFENFDDERLIGGQAIFSGSRIDEHNLEAVLWPTAAVVAEVLWGATGGVTVDGFHESLSKWICSMQRRGLKLSPIDAGHCFSAFAEDSGRGHIAVVVNEHHNADLLGSEKSDDGNSLVGGFIAAITSEESGTYETALTAPPPPAASTEPVVASYSTQRVQWQGIVVNELPLSEESSKEYALDNYIINSTLEFPPFITVAEHLEEDSSSVSFPILTMISVFGLGILIGVGVFKAHIAWAPLSKVMSSGPGAVVSAVFCSLAILFLVLSVQTLS